MLTMIDNPLLVNVATWEIHDGDTVIETCTQGWHAANDRADHLTRITMVLHTVTPV